MFKQFVFTSAEGEESPGIFMADPEQRLQLYDSFHHSCSVEVITASERQKELLLALAAAGNALHPTNCLQAFFRTFVRTSLQQRFRPTCK